MKTSKEIIVNDRMQTNYVYVLSCEEGKQFDPDFRPDLTPQEMLELGVFGGKYMIDCKNEFPESWFTNAQLDSEKYDKSLNHFGIKAESVTH
jgi:hypothetical protein